MSDSEWNNENTAASAWGIAIAVLAIIAVCVCLIASLAIPAHACTTRTAPVSSLVDGETAAATVASAGAEADSGGFYAIVGILLLLLITALAIWSIIDQYRRGGK